MDINLIVIISSAVILLLAMIIGFKMVFDRLNLLNNKNIEKLDLLEEKFIMLNTDSKETIEVKFNKLDKFLLNEFEKKSEQIDVIKNELIEMINTNNSTLYKKIIDSYMTITNELENKSEIIINNFDQNSDTIVTKFKKEFENQSDENENRTNKLININEQLNCTLQEKISVLIGELTNSIVLSKDSIQENIIESRNYLEEFTNSKSVDTNKSINNSIIEIKNLILTKIKEVDNNLNNSEKNVLLEIENYQQNISKYAINSEKNIINIKNDLENNFYNIVQLVNNLRLDNLINVNNEINKYREGIYEDDHFLQEVGHCKIIKITDKNSNEVTNVYYDDYGNKSITETFCDGLFKYKMEYANNKLKKGFEIDSNGNTVFEYCYNDAEEVSKKVEYIYDTNSNLLETKETNF